MVKWLPLLKWLPLPRVICGLKPPWLPPKPGAELASALEAVTVGLVEVHDCSLDGLLSVSFSRLSSYREKGAYVEGHVQREELVLVEARQRCQAGNKKKVHEDAQQR